MKFYGNGVVWDGEKNKRLCKFINGEFETDDERVINTLIHLGYKPDPEEAAEAIEELLDDIDEAIETDEGLDYKEMSYNKLKSLAKARGIKVGHKNKADLIEALKEGV